MNTLSLIHIPSPVGQVRNGPVAGIQSSFLSEGALRCGGRAVGPKTRIELLVPCLRFGVSTCTSLTRRFVWDGDLCIIYYNFMLDFVKTNTHL